MLITTKKCSKCKKDLPLHSFHKSKRTKIGLKSACKDCKSKDSTEFWFKNRERLMKENAEYGKTEESKSYQSKYYQERKEVKKLRAKLYAEKKKAEDIDLWRKSRASYVRNRRKNDAEYKILCCCRGRISCALRENAKRSCTRDLIGCSIEFYKRYLESLWVEGMSWENYGKGGWHIDHIVPCASFNLLSEEAQKRCFHYTNTQPLWEKDNFAKGSKIQKESSNDFSPLGSSPVDSKESFLTLSPSCDSPDSGKPPTSSQI